MSGHGPTATLEQRFRDLTGRGYAVAVSSGTAALSVALRAAEVRPGDTVFVPAYDWPAGAAAVLAAAARPIPVDVDLDTGFLSAGALAIAARSTAGARAVIATHLGGRPGDVAAVLGVAREAGLVLIEDCAQAIGAAIGGRSVGSTGDLAVFSLGPHKLIDAGEGGVLVTDQAIRYEAAVVFGQHPLYQRLRGVPPNRLHINTRVHPCTPLLALPQLDDLPGRLALLRANAGRWSVLFREMPGFVLPVMPNDAEPSCWTFAVRCDDQAWQMPADRVAALLQAEGVPVAKGPIGCTIPSILREAMGVQGPSCAAAEEWCRTAIYLPCPEAEESTFASFVDSVGAAVQRVFGARRGRQRRKLMLKTIAASCPRLGLDARRACSVVVAGLVLALAIAACKPAAAAPKPQTPPPPTAAPAVRSTPTPADSCLAWAVFSRRACAWSGPTGGVCFGEREPGYRVCVVRVVGERVLIVDPRTGPAYVDRDALALPRPSAGAR